MVKTLLDRGADVNAQCEGCHGVLQAAASGGNAEVVRMLLVKAGDMAMLYRQHH